MTGQLSLLAYPTGRFIVVIRKPEIVVVAHDPLIWQIMHRRSYPAGWRHKEFPLLCNFTSAGGHEARAGICLNSLFGTCLDQLAQIHHRLCVEPPRITHTTPSPLSSLLSPVFPPPTHNS